MIFLESGSEINLDLGWDIIFRKAGERPIVFGRARKGLWAFSRGVKRWGGVDYGGNEEAAWGGSIPPNIYEKPTLIIYISSKSRR